MAAGGGGGGEDISSQFIQQKFINLLQSIMDYEEHEKCAWSVDFSRTDPSMMVSGSDDFVLSNFTIYEIDVLSSFVKPGDTGVTIFASGATCNFSTSWKYQFYSWVLPVEIADQGRASIQVEGLQVGLPLGLVNQNGTLKLSLMDYGCLVEDLNIILDLAITLRLVQQTTIFTITT